MGGVRGQPLAQNVKPFISLEFAPPQDTSVPIDGMDVKDRLGNVDTRSANLHLGLLLIP